MFCLNSKKNDEELERRKIEEIEKFENERNHTNGLIIIFTLLGIIIFCIYYFNPFSIQKPQPVQITKPVTKIFGPDDIISPLLTSSSENKF